MLHLAIHMPYDISELALSPAQLPLMRVPLASPRVPRVPESPWPLLEYPEWSLIRALPAPRRPMLSWLAVRCDGIGRPQRQLVAPADSFSTPSTPSTPGPARRLQWFDPRGKGTAESRSDVIEPREYAEYPGYPST